jgi:hypothetical protein
MIGTVPRILCQLLLRVVTLQDELKEYKDEDGWEWPEAFMVDEDLNY